MNFLKKIFGNTSKITIASSSEEIKRQKISELPKIYLHLEGTKFPIFTSKELFYNECQSSGQAAMYVPFSEFSSANAYCCQNLMKNRETLRLLCASCLVEMSGSFLLRLLGFQGKIIAFTNIEQKHGTGLSDICPYCDSNESILLWNPPQYGEITDKDIEAIRKLWQYRFKKKSKQVIMLDVQIVLRKFWRVMAIILVLR